MNADVLPSTAVVEAVATAEGVDPVDVEQPLYEVVDVDALDKLLVDCPGRLTFEYYGYEVTLTSDGIELEDLPAT